MEARPAGRREWTALAVLCLPVLVVSMDVSVLFFAVPQIAADLQPSATQLLWIFDVYGFVLAGLLLTMGSVADRIGRRRLLLIGALAFALSSAVAAYAPTAEWLVLARALLGLGGSTLAPSTLAIIRSLFEVESERVRAVAIWSAVMAGGVGIGPVISGALLEHFWWGSVFLINVPLMVILLVVAPALVPESRHPAARVDVLSAVLSLAAILPIIHAIKGFAADGWTGAGLAYAAGGLLAAVAFVWRQGLVRTPMVDLTLFRVRGFGGSIAIQVIGMFGVMGNAILVTQYLQSVLGLSPFTAALWSLAPSVVVGVAAPAAAALSGRVGRPPVMAGAFLVAAAGFGLMRLAAADSSVWPALVASTFVAVGLVAVASLVTEYAIGVAPRERAGAVSALVETSAELGGALGMALLGSLLGAVYRSRVADLVGPVAPAGVTARASETLGEAVVVSAQVGGAEGKALLDAARTAYVDAMHVTDLAAGAVLVLGAVLAVTLLPRRGAQPVDVRYEAAPTGR